MKRIQFLTFTLLLVFTFLLPTQVATAKLKATLEGHTDNVWSVAFSPNGKMLASASWDRTVRLWNVDTEQLLYNLPGHTDVVLSVAFSPDGQTVVSGSWDGTIRLWDPRTGKLKRTLAGHAGGVASVAFSPDGQTLAGGNADRTIQLWNTNTWKLEKTLTGHTDIVEVVAFATDGALLASGSRDATIRLWNPRNGKHIKTLKEHTDAVLRIAFSTDGNTLASGSSDETVRLWDPNTGQHQRTLTNQTGWTKPIAFSFDGATLLIGGQGISVWDTEINQYKIPLATDIGDALSVVFSPDGQMVASGSTDKKIRLWEFNASDYEIPSITTNGMVRLVYFLPNDRPARPERITALRQLIKDAQQFFAENMESHGFGRKTFTVETGKDGEPIVHRVDGKFTENYYYEPVSDFKIWPEVNEHFNDPQHVYLIAIDLSHEGLNAGDSGGLGGVSYFSFSGGTQVRLRDETEGEEVLGGMAIIPASGEAFENLAVTIHELGHAFGLDHDFRAGQRAGVVDSKCAAEWLSVSRFFNTKPIFANTPGEIQILSTQIYNQDAINIRFKVTDSDGLHQAQLLVPEIAEGTGSAPYRLFDCKNLNGKTNTIEAAVRTAELADRITLQIMDVNGNITWATFPLQLDAETPDRNVLDVNRDGIMNLLDLTRIASHFGRRGQDSADVNEDKVVDITDVLLVAAGISSVSRRAVETFSAGDVQKWLNEVKQLQVENEFQQKGIFFLQYLLAEITLSSKPKAVVKPPLKAIFDRHTDLVWSLAFSSDGQTLASGSWDGTIRLWNPRTLRHETTLIGHSNQVRSVAFSPDGQTLASGSWDRTVRLWDTSTGELKTTLSGYNVQEITSIAFSPNGQTLAVGTESSSGNHTIHLWDPNTEHYKTNLAGHTESVTFIAFSPDGQTLASGSGDQTIRLWNTTTWKLKRTLTGHTQSVESVAFSPDGQTLASGSRDRTIRLWNPRTGKLKRTLSGYTDWISPLAFSPDGETLAGSSQDQRIRLWNTQTGEYKNSLQETGHVISVAFSPDGRTLASGGEDKTVRLWDVQTLLEQSPTLEPLPNKITGPWLWMIAPTEPGRGGADSTDVDSLADASGGNVTEADVAANGAREGDAVGNYVWTLGEIAEAGTDNINEVINNTSMAQGDVDDHSSYALITLESTTAQSNVTMRVGSDDSIKVWLNGEVVHNNPINRGANDFQDTFQVNLVAGDNLLLVKVSERESGWSMFVGIEADVNAIYKRPPDAAVSVDVNGDGIVNIQDLVLVSSNLGQTGQSSADVNGDGIVNIQDLVMVAGALGQGTAASPPLHASDIEGLTAAEIQDLLTQARQMALTDPAYLRGIAVLEQLLALLLPKETALLPNYPNPFNPETWIPYQLSKPAEVTLDIYAVDGRLIRRLALGYQPAGIYQSKARAAYWDGRNNVGEPVASGVYFYTLSTESTRDSVTAGKFTATQKMLIVK